MTHSLQVTVHRANHLDDVEHFGKNDPYAQITLNFADSHSFQKTSVKKNGGKDVEWEQTLTLEEFDQSEHHDLYVEVLDDETTVDAPIGFTAIPLHQVLDAPGRSFKGKFDLFTPDGKQKGTISLTVTVLQAGHSAHENDGPEVKGQSQIVSDHQKRIKALKYKEKAADGAALAGAAALAVGAKFLLDKHKDQKKAEKEGLEI
ncbi:C2 domain-containing protein [Dissophora ornata]|nr:hypothetical protein BGZ58_008045 [Dissophora ornata]KAI8601570.1 C2 domain-containing protein [Dissophora ornata]